MHKSPLQKMVFLFYIFVAEDDIGRCVLSNKKSSKMDKINDIH